MKWWIFMPTLVLKLTGLWLVFQTEALALGWLLFFSGGALVLTQMFLPRSQGLCDTCSAFRPQGKELWLTIDDGPCPEDTPALLEVLRRYNAKATFFLIGRRAAEYPELVDAILADGHTIGSHTHTHPCASFWAAGPGRVRRELDRSLSTLTRNGRAIRLFRAPVGIKPIFLASALRRLGLTAVAWTIRSGDALEKDPDRVLERVERQLKPGAILLMHEGPNVAPAVRVESIRRVLELLQKLEYRSVLPDQERFYY